MLKTTIAVNHFALGGCMSLKTDVNFLLSLVKYNKTVQFFKLKYNFVETPRRFITAELSICKLGSSSVLIINEGLSLRIESSAIINLRGVSTKL